MATPEEKARWTRWLDELMPPRSDPAAPATPKLEEAPDTLVWPYDVARAEGLSGMAAAFAGKAGAEADAELRAIATSVRRSRAQARRKRRK